MNSTKDKNLTLSKEQWRAANKLLLCQYLILFVLYFSDMLVMGATEGFSLKVTLFIITNIICAIISILAYKPYGDSVMGLRIWAVFGTLPYMLLIFNGTNTLYPDLSLIIITYLIFFNKERFNLVAMVLIVLHIVKVLYWILFSGEPLKEVLIESSSEILFVLLILFSASQAIKNLQAIINSNYAIIEDNAKKSELVATSVQEIVDGVSAKTITLDQAVTTIQNQITKNTQAMSDIAQNSQATADAISTQNRMTQEIQTQIQLMKTQSETVSLATNQISTAIENGFALVDNLNMDTTLVNKYTQDTTQAIMNLEKRVNAVTHITDDILSISNQTNMLALNASIEAARAGEAGRGFSVVADEIRMLSEQTKSSTNKITEIVSELTTVTKDTIASLSASNQSIEKQTEQIEQVNRNYVITSEHIEQLQESVQNMIQAITQVVSSTSHITDNIGQLTTTTQEVTANALEGVESSKYVDTQMQDFMPMIQEVFDKIMTLKEITQNQKDA